MPPEIIAIIDKPWLLALLLAIGAVCGIAVERVAEGMKKAERRAYWQGRNGRKTKRSSFPKSAPNNNNNNNKVDTAADQLRTIMSASFKARALLNQPERRLLSVLDKALESESPGWRAMGKSVWVKYCGVMTRTPFGQSIPSALTC